MSPQAGPLVLPLSIVRGLIQHGRPIQYAHIPEPLRLWDIWTKIAADPIAFEAPSAGFALDWRTLKGWRERGVAFATLSHAAGLSSTGDAALDRRLPFDEYYRIPEACAATIEAARRRSGRASSGERSGECASRRGWVRNSWSRYSLAY
jgi:S-adenosylmethionine:tRNA ribosyltransferase-isomerase